MSNKDKSTAKDPKLAALANALGVDYTTVANAYNGLADSGAITIPLAVSQYTLEQNATLGKNLDRLAGIIAEVVQALGIEVADDANLGPGPDICAYGDEAVAMLKGSELMGQSHRTAHVDYDPEGRLNRKILVVHLDKLEPITKECLDYAKSKRTWPVGSEKDGFAVEMAYQYGATPIDDDAELLAISSENMINLMAALGWEHRPNSSPVSAGVVDERVARVIGYRPGMSEVTLLVDGGVIPAWMNIGDTVCISDNARATLSAPSHGDQARDNYRVVKVGAEGVQFGNAWFSHEGITGYTAEQLNSGNCRITGRAYMDWLASAPSAGSQEPQP